MRNKVSNRKATHECIRQMRKATSRVIIPYGLQGLAEVANYAEKIARDFSFAFWNIPPRSTCSDAEYIGLVVSVLKKRAGRQGIQCALDIIDMLQKENADTSLEERNTVDSFSCTKKDEIAAFRASLHIPAINKLLALAARASILDYYDICEMIRTGKPVVAYVWAACGAAPEYTPESLLDALLFHGKYSNEDFLSHGIDSVPCKNLFQSMVHEAREKFSCAPIDECGVLYLKKNDLSVFFPSKKEFEEKDYIPYELCSSGIFQG